MSDSRKIPGSRLGRLARLASVGARTGANILMGRESAADAVAKKAAETLGTLRGIAAKVGQMAGYVDGVVPEEQREAYERWMKTLLEQAPTSSPEAVRARVLEQLGVPLEQAFAAFDEHGTFFPPPRFTNFSLAASKYPFGCFQQLG